MPKILLIHGILFQSVKRPQNSKWNRFTFQPSCDPDTLTISSILKYSECCSSFPQYCIFNSSVCVHARIDAYVLVSCLMRVNVAVFIHLLKDYESNLNSAKARRRVIFHVLPEIKAIFYGLRARESKIKVFPSFYSPPPVRIQGRGSNKLFSRSPRGETCRNCRALSRNVNLCSTFCQI